MPKVFRYYKGTRAGGLKAAETNRKKHGKDFYSNIGRKGGSIGTTGGFATVDKNGRHTLAQKAGRKGGAISRRGKDLSKRKTRTTKKPDELGPLVSSIERKYRKENKSFFKRLFKR